MTTTDKPSWSGLFDLDTDYPPDIRHGCGCCADVAQLVAAANLATTVLGEAKTEILRLKTGIAALAGDMEVWHNYAHPREVSAVTANYARTLRALITPPDAQEGTPVFVSRREGMPITPMPREAHSVAHNDEGATS